jgi:hypothetical protein
MSIPDNMGDFIELQAGALAMRAKEARSMHHFVKGLFVCSTFPNFNRPSAAE